jgi:signal transduction histidine kinase
MKLLIIRHADPDYEKDTLTEKGWREAELLSNRLITLDIKEFYVSPLGRARDTANVTLKKMNRTAEVLPWLREFNVYDEKNKEGTGLGLAIAKQIALRHDIAVTVDSKENEYTTFSFDFSNIVSYK